VTAALPQPIATCAFESLARRAGTRVLFEAASRICAPYLVARMEDLAARRAAAGDSTSALVPDVGELRPSEVFALDGEGDDETWAVLLTRPHQKHAQLLLVSRDGRLPRRPLRLGRLTNPLARSKVERIFGEMRADREFPIPATEDAFSAWLIDGARASVDLALPATAECAQLAAELLRRLAEPTLADALCRQYPLDLDYDEEGEIAEEVLDELLDDAETVADDFALWLGETASELDADALAAARADALLAFGFRADYLGAGAREPWSDEELDAFLLSYVPRKVMTRDDDRLRIPGSLARLFAFLGERGHLVQPLADKLARRAAALAETFAQRADDRTRQGPSGALLAAMAAEGVDIGDADAMQAWIAAFNARPFEERDAILGPSLPALPYDEP
jgi:hypothetical protein